MSSATASDQERTEKKALGNVRFEYRKRQGQTHWFCVFERRDGVETFCSKEAGEDGKWVEYTASAKERTAVLEEMSRQRSCKAWRASISLDDEVANCFLDLGRFPTCIHQELFDLQSVELDVKKPEEMTLARRRRSHGDTGERLVREVYAWYREGRVLRDELERLAQ